MERTMRLASRPASASGSPLSPSLAMLERAARLSDEAMAAQVTSSMGRSWNLGAVAPAELDGTSLRKTRRFGRICSADRQRDCEAAAHGGREHAANFK
ncbi:unnamed protein product [Effrenium voratum]|uniref:Uncharacterized protein n=1 Tax=Effrenium voratum TaxID=2562239 RepID=A0AA36I4F8_9DINO|nr:unnamed protein product [Effrenium voratum]